MVIADLRLMVMTMVLAVDIHVTVLKYDIHVTDVDIHVDNICFPTPT